MNNRNFEIDSQNALDFASILISRMVKTRKDGTCRISDKAPDALAYDNDSAPVIETIRGILAKIDITPGTLFVNIDTQPIHALIFDRAMTAKGMHTHRAKELDEPAQQILREITARLPPNNDTPHRILTVQGVFDNEILGSIDAILPQTIVVAGSGTVRISGMTVVPFASDFPVDFNLLAQVISTNPTRVLPQCK